MQLPKTMPDDVAARFAAVGEPAQSRLLEIRELVLKTAEDEGIEALEETLKWGQPAYVPGRQGTTVRLGEDAATGGCKLYVHCQTSLVDEWRGQFGSSMKFESNRAILIDADGPLPAQELSICIASALTYDTDRRAKNAIRKHAHG